MSVYEKTILADLVCLMSGLTDWEYSGRISRETRLFADLGLQSMETVALFGTIQNHYHGRIPFGDLLVELDKRKQRDIRLGDLVDFLCRHLHSAAGARRSEEPQ